MKIAKFIMPLMLAAGTASASETILDVAGGARMLYGYSDVATRYEPLDQNNHYPASGFVYLSAEQDFDNGYSAAVYLDLMAASDKEIQNFNNGSWGKEIYASISAPWGQWVIGETFNAAVQLAVGAPSAEPLGVNNSDIVDFISNPNWYRRNSTYTSFKTLNSTNINTDGVAPKISYYTPEFYGTTVGVTYTPDTDNRRGLVNRFAKYARDDAYVLAAVKETDLGFANLATSVGYGIYHKNDKEFSAGMALQRGNWTVGGSYRKAYVDGSDYAITTNSNDPKAPDLFDNYREGEAWNLGIGYRFGPLQTSLTYFEAKAENTDNQDKILMLANEFQLNKYVNIYAAAAKVDFRGENDDIRNNNKGYAFVAGVGVDF